MPDITIEVRGSWIGDRKAAFIDAVWDAVVACLKVPPDDRIVRLVEHAAGNFAVPQGAGEKYTHIEIALFAGRSTDTKRALYRQIVGALAPFGVPPDDVKILLIELPRENVGFRGGRAAADVALGYETAV